MTVVSNSSPLIILARAGQLRLLAHFYERILIPPEVHEEVTVTGRGLPGAEEVRNAEWIEVRKESCEEDPILAQACSGLGAGESAAILLAKVLHADVLLVDERKARRIAEAAGIPVLGCIGILEAGTRAGKVSDLRSVYTELLKHGIRFDLTLLRNSLARLGLPEL